MNIPSRVAAAALLVALVTPVPAQAGWLRVSAGGTYSTAAPASGFSAPGATWSFSFLVDENPAPIAALTETGLFTTVPFTAFEFLLDGVAVPSALSTSFYNAGNGGGLDVAFFDVNDPAALFDGLSFFGPQMYSGDEFSPTIVPGTYGVGGGTGGTGFDLVVGGVSYSQATVNIVISRVPLPGTAALAGLALLALGLVRRTGLASPVRRGLRPAAAGA